MKKLFDYINEEKRTFVDEETGELVVMYVPDIDIEDSKKIAAQAKADIEEYNKKVKKSKPIWLKSEKLADERWFTQNELNDLNREYKQLLIDQEEELGLLYSSGNEREAEAKAQEYGEQFDKIQLKQEELKKKIAKLNSQIEDLDSKYWEIWK